MATTIPDLFNSTEAAKYAQVSDSLIRRYCGLGVIPAERIGRNWVISKREMDKFKRTKRLRGNPNFRR